MTYRTLLRRLWFKRDLSLEAVRDLLEDALSTIAKAAEKGPVWLPGFGTFEVRQSKGKRVVTPDGREFHTLPSRALKFSPAKQQKRTVRR